MIHAGICDKMGKIYRKGAGILDQNRVGPLLEVSLGRRKADLVLKNARIADVFTETIREGDIAVRDGMVAGVGSYRGEREEDLNGAVVAPGFIDAHMHLESSMVAPSILAETLLPRGTTAVVADPHEIANVCGPLGVEYLMRDSADSPLDVFFSLPSCVPLGENDHNGGTFSAQDVERFAADPRVAGLGEVMDCRSALNGNPELLRKIELMRGKTVDGHAPGLTGRELQAYRLLGIETDHECSTYEEALERLRAGFIVQVREGSAARNLTAILSGALRDGLPLDRFVFCTDDVHLDDAEKNGHIDRNIRMAVGLGMEPVRAIRMATLNAARAYGMKDRGAVAPGYRADLVVLDDLGSISVREVYKNGVPLSELPRRGERTPAEEVLTHSVRIPELSPDCLRMPACEFPVIGIVPGQLITRKLIRRLPEKDGLFAPAGDLLKAAVVQRHDGSGRIGLGAVAGFGLKHGAAASTVAHDAHNLIVIGDSDADMLAAVGELKACGGGYTLVSGGKVLKTVRLNIAGLFTDDRSADVGRDLRELSALAHGMGVPEDVDVFQNLSFLSLPVIPELRITDDGVFDVGEGRCL